MFLDIASFARDSRIATYKYCDLRNGTLGEWRVVGDNENCEFGFMVGTTSMVENEVRDATMVFAIMLLHH